MALLAQIGDDGKVAWLGLALLAFWAAWPLGLAVVAFLVTGGRTRAPQNEAQRASGRGLDQRRTVRDLAQRTSAAASLSSGTQACNTCRTIELNHLEVQESEFRAFLNRLCLARTTEEFDRFVAEQRHGGAGLSFERSGA